MLSLRTVTDTSREAIMTRLIQRIRTGKIKQGYVRENERSRFLQLVGEVVQSDNSTFKDLLRLAEAITRLEIPYDEL